MLRALGLPGVEVQQPAEAVPGPLVSIARIPGGDRGEVPLDDQVVDRLLVGFVPGRAGPGVVTLPRTAA